MNGFQDFFMEADALTMQIKGNGNRVKTIRNKLELHSRVSRFRAVSRYVEKATRIFRTRLIERKNGDGQ